LHSAAAAGNAGAAFAAEIAAGDGWRRGVADLQAGAEAGEPECCERPAEGERGDTEGVDQGIAEGHSWLRWHSLAGERCLPAGPERIA
jgi:hypothetical protein